MVDYTNTHKQMGVSKNNGTPKSSILIGFSIINHPFWGTPIFGNTQINMVGPGTQKPKARAIPRMQNYVPLNLCTFDSNKHGIEETNWFSGIEMDILASWIFTHF